MVLRSLVWKQVVSAQTCKRFSASAASSDAASDVPPKRPLSNRIVAGPGSTGGKSIDPTTFYKSISHSERQKRSQERDFLVSVLSSSPTKRDAKKYLQTFGGDNVSKALSVSKKAPHLELQLRQQAQADMTEADGSYYAADSIRSVSSSPRFVQGPERRKVLLPVAADRPHVAIVKLQDPDSLDDATLGELAKTFVQLRALGLISVIVVGRTTADGHAQHGWLDYVTHETLRVAAAIDQYGDPVTSLVDSSVSIDDSMVETQHQNLKGSPFVPGQVFIDRAESLMRPLRNGDIVVIPPCAYSTKQCEARPVAADDIVLALTKFFSGIHPQPDTAADASQLHGRQPQPQGTVPRTAAVVDRIIVIDPIGGTPSKRRPNGAHLFLNLEEEYQQAKLALDKMRLRVPKSTGRVSLEETVSPREVASRHKANLDIARQALALLPSSASALLTTPAEAANLVSPERDSVDDADVFGYVGSVGTRRSQNPLIHNLLTDRPVFSSSLPLGRIKPKTKIPASGATGDSTLPRMAQTTLVKRGMPLTVFPDPRKTPWKPPVPGGPRLRLTDTCIDLPRLVHLINDSFDRELDVEHYLRRVENSLAGVIIAGEYEGGAILTWERPAGLDEETAFRTGRLVPYLDKFAVLKKSQGAGGVADIVFTSMVRDCLPDGVCWRSRKDNPVNRWYFERSRGSWKLDGVNWTMFWTSPWETVGERGIWDYQSVCRNIEPSWADKKHILD
ncbi:acetylglutamate synthase [Grosmannia clavigera kw1407]|uniref:Amino-acid acetyltransferase, mitochondrial n=1 Tax=Grosmannia clavigera (strain kw1407 / UAMH 11150) TaxID=655863 RepID=F0XI04_GROCL|nr:acetylglutamate synthase [Grosmannia clavigera kw1407]EFX03151.1 acetylglutamate synthase [Grosmannia clavigera kw1407]